MHGSQAAVGARYTAPASASQRIQPRRGPLGCPPRPGPARPPAGAGRPRAHPIATSPWKTSVAVRVLGRWCRQDGLDPLG